MVVPMLVPTESFLRATEVMASRAAGMSVKIKRLSLRALPQPMVLVEGLTIKDVNNKAPRATVASGRALIALWPLFYGRVELTGIRLRDVILSISNQTADEHIRIVHVDMLRGLIQPKRGKSRHSYWNARMYGGSVHMHATVSTSKGGRQSVSAKLEMDSMQVQPWLVDMADLKKASGMLSSTLNIEATGAEAKALLDSLKVDGPIHLTNVEIATMDVSHVLKDKKSGQVTLQLKQKPVEFKFVNLMLHMRGRDALLDDIALYSSRLEATGKITVKNGSQLEGRIMPSGLPGLLGVSMLVSGTLEHPEMHPAPPDLKGTAVDITPKSKLKPKIQH